jgi:hypothetical protein
MQLVIVNLALERGRYRPGIEGEAVKRTSADEPSQKDTARGKHIAYNQHKFTTNLPLFCIKFSYTKT